MESLKDMSTRKERVGNRAEVFKEGDQYMEEKGRGSEGEKQ